MARGARQPLDLDGLLARLPAIVTSPDLDEALRQAAVLAAHLAGSNTCYLLVGENQRVQKELWHGPGGDGQNEARLACARVARATLTRSAEAVTREASEAHLVASSPSLHGIEVVCCVENWQPNSPEGTRTRERVARLATLIARKVQAHTHTSQAQAKLARYERWFNRLDEQTQVLDRERQKFAAMVSQTENLVFVTGLDRKIQWTNPALTGLAPGESGSWEGETCRAVCRGWSAEGTARECTSCPVSRAAESGKVTHAEYHPRTPDGPGTFYLTALPIQGPDGKPREIMVTVQDLSDLESLRKSETRYRALFEKSTDALLMVDPDRREVLFANPAAGRLFGRPETELAKLSLRALHPESEWTHVEAAYGPLLKGEAGEGFEAALSARDGAERFGWLRASRVDLEGRPATLLQIRDVTESRRVRRALRQAEERLSVVISNSPVILFATDAKGVFTLSEGKGLRALGLAPGEAVGRSAFDMYRDVPGVVEHLRRALQGEEFSDIVTAGAHSFETRYTPLRDDTGTVTGVIGVAADVSERRGLEERLRQSQKLEAVGRLAAGVAHDFNNLLTGILGACDLILRDAPRNSPLQRRGEEIQSAGLRGALLTRQLLAFGRREVLAPKVHDASQVVHNLLDMLQRLVGEDIDLVTRFSPEPAIVRADQTQLEQVLMTLVVNARDAMPEGGKVTLEVRTVELDGAYCRTHADAAPGPHVMIAISDEGRGMDAETRSRIFEPFFTTKGRGHGAGLGLAAVYGITRQWNGHVSVYSEPGRGSVFKIFLPRVPDPAGAGPAPRPLSELARGTETVLLVEDEETVRAVAREFLLLQGYRVLVARDGVEALELAQDYEDTIHLLLTDVVMPRMGGGELVPRILEARPAIRVLYVSGYPDDAVVRHGLLDDQAAFLAKPFTLPALAARVRETLDGPPHRERVGEKLPAA